MLEMQLTWKLEKNMILMDVFIVSLYSLTYYSNTPHPRVPKFRHLFGGQKKSRSSQRQLAARLIHCLLSCILGLPAGGLSQPMVRWYTQSTKKNTSPKEVYNDWAIVPHPTNK
jgi:hypothetical protein